MNLEGFTREEGVQVINAFIETVKESVRNSPRDGSFPVPGFGTFKWHRYKGSWIREVPRTYIKLSMVTYQKKKFFDRCGKRLAENMRRAPWFIGAEAREIMKGGNDYGSSVSGNSRRS